MKITNLMKKAHYIAPQPADSQLSDYHYAVTCNSRFLTGWGFGRYNKPYDVVLCRSFDQAMQIMRGMKHDGDSRYINFWSADNIPFKADRIYSIRWADDCPVWLKEV